MPRYTDEELEQLADFIANRQRELGAALVMQMVHFEAAQVEVNTELENHNIVAGKFLITSVVRPLTEELRASFGKINDTNNKNTDKPQPIPE